MRVNGEISKCLMSTEFLFGMIKRDLKIDMLYSIVNVILGTGFDI